MTHTIKLSILVRTHNHDRYITEALDSALMQNTSFDYEIVIGDDCSTDNTRELLIRLQNQNPGRIRLVLHDERVGPRRNLQITMEACHGKYVAMLDGDDYWTSVDKLQKQVDFLDKHTECPMCCHNSQLVYETPDIEATPLITIPLKTFLGVDDLLVMSPALPTTTVSRREAALGVPDAPQVLLRDKAYAVALAHRYGPIGYIGDVMSTWRIHGGGVLNSKYLLPPRDRRIKSHTNQIEFYEAIDQYLDYRHHPHIASLVVKHYYALAWTYARKRNWSEAFEQLRKGWTVVRLPGERTTIRSTGKSITLLWQSIRYQLWKDMEVKSRIREHTKAAESSLARK